MKSKYEAVTEIQVKSILVRVIARFELARVRVNGMWSWWHDVISPLFEPQRKRFGTCYIPFKSYLRPFAKSQFSVGWEDKEQTTEQWSQTSKTMQLVFWFWNIHELRTWQLFYTNVEPQIFFTIKVFNKGGKGNRVELTELLTLVGASELYERLSASVKEKCESWKTL